MERSLVNSLTDVVATTLFGSIIRFKAHPPIPSTTKYAKPPQSFWNLVMVLVTRAAFKTLIYETCTYVHSRPSRVTSVNQKSSFLVTRLILLLTG